MNKSDICRKIYHNLGNAENILDVGCDGGKTTVCLARMTNKKIIGLDISNSGFMEARKRALRHKVSDLVICIKGDVHKMDFDDGKFDAVTIVHSLHHMEHPDKALKEIRRVLKLKGKLLMAEYTIKKRGSKCRKFISEQMNKMLENSGFQPLSIEQPEEGSIFVVAEK